MTRCLKKYKCPQTRLEALSYTICLPLGRSNPKSSDGEIPWSKIGELQEKFSGEKDIKVQDDRVIGECVNVYQNINQSLPLIPQLNKGFGFLEKVKTELKQPVESISMNPIHDNLGFFVWDFREHETLLKEWGKFGKKTGGIVSEAHDYAEIFWKK